MIAAPAKIETATTPARCAVVHAWMTTQRRAELEAIAQARRTHPDRLVAQLLEVVLSVDRPDELVAAMLEP